MVGDSCRIVYLSDENRSLKQGLALRMDAPTVDV